MLARIILVWSKQVDPNYFNWLWAVIILLLLYIYYICLGQYYGDCALTLTWWTMYCGRRDFSYLLFLMHNGEQRKVMLLIKICIWIDKYILILYFYQLHFKAKINYHSFLWMVNLTLYMNEVRCTFMQYGIFKNMRFYKENIEN